MDDHGKMLPVIRESPSQHRLGGSPFTTFLLWLHPMAYNCCLLLPGSSLQFSAYAEASSYALPLVLAAWVLADARKRRLQLCYDYDSFLYLVWPILLPVYLFQTRGMRAFVTLLCFAAIWMITFLVAFIITLLRDSLIR